MAVVSFAFESCFRGSVVGRAFAGLLTAAALAASLFFLTVLLQSAFQFLLMLLTRPQATQPVDFLLTLGGAVVAGLSAAAVTFLFFGRSLGCAFA
jgi:hypothetical protein